jgi:hypothetical protein
VNSKSCCFQGSTVFNRIHSASTETKNEIYRYLEIQILEVFVRGSLNTVFQMFFLFIFAEVVFFQIKAYSLERAIQSKFKLRDKDDKKQSTIAQGIGGQP